LLGFRQLVAVALVVLATPAYRANVAGATAAVRGCRRGRDALPSPRPRLAAAPRVPGAGRGAGRGRPGRARAAPARLVRRAVGAARGAGPSPAPVPAGRRGRHEPQRPLPPGGPHRGRRPPAP